MAKCANCGTTILFGGVEQNGMRYCGEDCTAISSIGIAAQDIPDDFLDEQVTQRHQGPCPVCNGPGPIDVQVSHRITSFLILTSWNDRTRLSCGRCGRFQRLGDMFYCLVLGWWGFPWGVIGTPIQLVRNFVGMFRGSSPVPSDALRGIVMMELGARLAAHKAAAQQNAQQPYQPNVEQ